MTDRMVTRSSIRGAVVGRTLRTLIESRTISSVLDVGGGTGGFAEPLAREGLAVTVVEPNQDSLASLQRRFAEKGLADRVTAIQGEVEELSRLVDGERFDLVLCHGFLEVVESPADALAAVASVLAEHGVVSVLASGRGARVISQAIVGRFGRAELALNGDLAAVPRWFGTEELFNLVRGAGLTIEAFQGVRVVVDLVPGTVVDEPGAMANLMRLELELAGRPEFVSIASQIHVVASR